GEIAKDVEAVLRRDPDVSFTIFKNPRDEVAGQAVRLRVHISAALVYMQEAAVQGPDPQTAIAVLQQPFWFEPAPSAWKCIGNALTLNELPDSVLGNDQQFAVVVLIQRLRIADRGVRHRVMRRRARPPSPQPGLSRCPECAAAVLVQRSHPLAETAALALYVATLDRAQPPGRTCVPAGPYRSFVIHKERIDAVASELRILGQPAVHPTGKTFQRADPDSPIARGEQTSNPPVGELFISGRVPGHTPNAVEAQHAEFRPQPQITIGRLRNGSDLPLCKAFAEGPCRVRVLVEVESDIQRVRTWAAHEGNDQRDHPLRESRPFEYVGPRHDGSCAHGRKSSSEQVPHGELDLARRAETFRPSERVEELSEAARRQEVCVRRRRQLQAVDDVVDLDSQLHRLVASQMYVLEKRRVHLNEVRPAL